MTQYVLALDQGTTSSRAILFDHDAHPVAVAQQEFQQILPAPGDVEHDPEAIWASQIEVAREVLVRAEVATTDVVAIGIANQRETTILWDRATGRPVCNAVVWQSRVSAPICARLRAEGCETVVQEKTGLLLDPYFSATKITHLLDSIDGLRHRAEAGEILFGTVDSWLIWRLTGGRAHVTDVSNASRTMLLNIDTLSWDDELLQIFRVPRAMLPEVRSSSEVYGMTDPAWLGAPLPIAGAAGDQQAATFGQACFTEGSVKNTYGTGCFMLMTTGRRRSHPGSKLLTTIGWQLDGKVTYCLEGSVFIGGAVVGWLRDGLGLIKTSTEVEALAASVPDSGGVLFVPAFVGLGAPHWDPYARGAILGLTRGTTAAHIARAAVESMAYQSYDLLRTMQTESQTDVPRLKVDGGAAANNALLQFQADLLGIPVERPVVAETTALGAAYLAGLAVGYWENTADLAHHWQLDREFTPQLAPAERRRLEQRWHEAVRRSLSWETAD